MVGAFMGPMIDIYLPRHPKTLTVHREHLESQCYLHDNRHRLVTVVGKCFSRDAIELLHQVFHRACQTRRRLSRTPPITMPPRSPISSTCSKDSSASTENPSSHDAAFSTAAASFALSIKKSSTATKLLSVHRVIIQSPSSRLRLLR